MTAADLVQNYALSRDRQHGGKEGENAGKITVDMLRWICHVNRYANGRPALADKPTMSMNQRSDAAMDMLQPTLSGYAT